MPLKDLEKDRKQQLEVDEVESQSGHSNSNGPITWTPEEEKKLVRKIDLFLMPTIWLMYLLSYMVSTSTTIAAYCVLTFNAGPHEHWQRQNCWHERRSRSEQRPVQHCAGCVLCDLCVLRGSQQHGTLHPTGVDPSNVNWHETVSMVLNIESVGLDSRIDVAGF